MQEVEQRKRRGRPRRDEVVALDREQIVAEALRLIDERGLDAFSLRELARALGVFPTALYWHMPGGRNAVLGAVAATAFTNVVPPAEDAVDDWEKWIRALFVRYRESLRKHPNIAPLLGAQIVSNTGVDIELVERILAALESAGFRGERLRDAYNTVVAGMLGYVTLELAPSPAEDASEWAQAFEADIRGVDADRFPRLARNLDLLANRAFIVRWQGGAEKPMAHSFDFYVEAIIAGLRALSRSPA
ncbi:TetR family transcriptional regulator [Bosea vestrisii]|uniref:TetR family transcriptional regulator n=1 Tax=Bosea vestrisii TaxID=151416 RepID=UPI0024DF8D0F|nr:TetR family transcriptional regulator [Bosea vestrisii]WID94898.1 TetR family transcriptional regulator [Bosea vestrisii]